MPEPIPKSHIIELNYYSKQKVPREWCSSYSMAEELRWPPATMANIYTILLSKYGKAIQEGSTSISAYEFEIPVESLKVFHSNSPKLNEKGNHIYIHRNMIPKLQELTDPNIWIGVMYMAKITGTPHETLKPLYDELTTNYRKAKETGAAGFSAGGITIPTDKAKLFYKGPTTSFLRLHKSATDTVREWVNTREKLQTPAVGRVRRKSLKPGSEDLARTGVQHRMGQG